MRGGLPSRRDATDLDTPGLCVPCSVLLLLLGIEPGSSPNTCRNPHNSTDHSQPDPSLSRHQIDHGHGRRRHPAHRADRTAPFLGTALTSHQLSYNARSASLWPLSPLPPLPPPLPAAWLSPAGLGPDTLFTFGVPLTARLAWRFVISHELTNTVKFSLERSGARPRNSTMQPSIVAVSALVLATCAPVGDAASLKGKLNGATPLVAYIDDMVGDPTTTVVVVHGCAVARVPTARARPSRRCLLRPPRHTTDTPRAMMITPEVLCSR